MVLWPEWLERGHFSLRIMAFLEPTRGARDQNLPGCLHSLRGGVEFWVWVIHHGFLGKTVLGMEKICPLAPFQLSENSKPCKTRQLIIITMIVITVIIASVFWIFNRYYASVSQELSQSIFLMTPGGRYCCYSYFQMRRLGTGRVASMVR